MDFKTLREEIDSIRARDPAARSSIEVILCYPGFHVLRFYHLAHALWKMRLNVPARMLSNLGKLFTGIEIHPGAEIGRNLFIDHGAGVVIGETAIIGDEVTMYHGVTLGGTSLSHGKRHPTLGNGVIVGAGAKILGPIHVGDGARIGANAVVLSDVPAGVTMVGIPAKIALGRGKGEGFHAYGCDEDLPDPMVRTIENLRQEVTLLLERIEALEGEKVNGSTPPVKRKRAKAVEGDQP